MDDTKIKTLTTKRRAALRSDMPMPVNIGRVPPQSRELEEAVLGAIMLEKSAFDVVSEILKAECFYVEANQVIFSAFASLAEKSLPIDMLTVTEELKMQSKLDMVGGPYTIMRLTNLVISSANIEAHARIILQKFIQRELIRVSSEIISEAFEDGTDAFDLLDVSESKLFEITNNYLKKNFEDIGTAVLKTLDRINHLKNAKDTITGVPTGFRILDKITYGWQATDLIVLAARPGVGKTFFALNLSCHAALNETKKTGVAFFSLEMSATQLVQRILSSETEIKLEKISRGQLNDQEIQQLYDRGLNKLSNAPIYIDDTAALNIFEFRAKARRLVNKYKVGLIIIDYLQLMRGLGDRNSNREQEISRISRDLKGIAKELQVPIIALSQLNRGVENRKETKMPQLSDLRESGAIEQDADMVIFLYRPELYEIDKTNENTSNTGETILRIAKHRNGKLDTIKLKALLDIQKFVEYDDTPLGFTPYSTANMNIENGAKMYIELGSKMNYNPGDSDTTTSEDPF